MKISEFAEKYGVSNDTIRYYMKLNLIIPEKKGGHYYFDQKCEQQISEVYNLFACPVCGQDLLLEAEEVRANQVINGSLNCSCGNSLKIRDGILYTGDLKESTEEIGEEFFDDYLQSTNADYLGTIVYGLDWMQRQLNQYDLQNKVILEPGSGFGFLLRQIYQKLPASSVYICVDNRAGINILLKQILETIKAETSVIFLTAELPVLPLKKDSVDTVIDYTGTSNYSFEKPGFLIELLDKYLKRDLKLFACYLIYQKFGLETIIQEEFRDYYKLNYVKEKLKLLGYQIQKEQEAALVVDKAPGKYENFARSGDVVKGYQLVAERWS